MRTLSVQDFLDTKMRPFSAQSNVRGIPFIGDGFKEVQRKVIYGLLERGESKGIDTVERVSAYICSVSNYHHGAVSVEDTVIKMAQKFPGTNNISLLVDDGQFGSRKNFGGSASRYISTDLHENFRKIFKKEDDCITRSMYDGNIKIEPEFYIPTLPLILVNGAVGIGTGHATTILSYNPADIVAMISQYMETGEMPEKFSLVPWFGQGFKGTVERNKDTGQVLISGVWNLSKKGRSNILTITELPPSIQGDKYKTLLDELESQGLIKDYDDLSDKNGFEYVIHLTDEVAAYTEKKLIAKFLLVEKVTENFTVWNPDGVLQRYPSAEALLVDWVNWRIKQYVPRFDQQVINLQRDLDFANEKKQWISLYIANAEFCRDSSTDQILEFMRANNLTRTDDLLSIPVRSLTRDKILEHEKTIKKLEDEIARIKGLSPKTQLFLELKSLNF